VRDLALITAPLAAGIGLGLLFFGGLWWTVNRGLTAALPAVWFGLSSVLRVAVIVCGLYGFARLGLPSLIACLVGFLIARSAVTRLTRLTRLTV